MFVVSEIYCTFASEMKKAIYITIGSISFGLGILGIFLPVLPTTPFLLLTAALYARSSDKLYLKLLNNRYLGSYIRNFREEKSIPLHAKIIAITSIWVVILYSIIFILSGKLILQILLGAIATAVSIHILSYKTKSKFS